MNQALIKRRRASDRQPSRETFLQELCAKQAEELLLYKAENNRLRQQLAKLRTEARTIPGELL